MMTELPATGWSIPRLLFRAAVVIAIAVGTHVLMDWVQSKATMLSPQDQALMLTSILALFLVSYAVLIAVPFVPGIEIGLTLILLRGAEIAPFVYGATVIGLSIAYLAGRFMPQKWLYTFLLDIRLTRAAAMLQNIIHLPPAQRLDLLRNRLPDWLGRHLVRWRYPLLAALINIPGNVLIGGGGGISLIAGLSRVFTPAATILTFALAVAPVPLLVWFFGIELLH